MKKKERENKMNTTTLNNCEKLQATKNAVQRSTDIGTSTFVNG